MQANKVGIKLRLKIGKVSIKNFYANQESEARLNC